ncbi:MAG: thioredoxin-dependent thiol peroxidase [Candidatus Pacearchaeota archaeon]|jgi:peroxiredoxin Q/BCP
MVIANGSAAPIFSLNDKDEKILSLKDIKSSFIVIYFYPKDNTPGCTIEAKEFSERLEDFKKVNTTVIGISGLNSKSKRKFVDNNKLKLTLLSDSDFEIAKRYDSYGEKSFMGRKYNGIFRNTYILDKNKKIIKVYENVKALGHAKEVLEYIKGLK